MEFDTSILHDSWNKQYLYVIIAIQVVRSRSNPLPCLISSKGCAKGAQSLFSIPNNASKYFYKNHIRSDYLQDLSSGLSQVHVRQAKREVK